MKDLEATLHKVTEKNTAIGPITGYNWTSNGSLGDSWLKAKFVFNVDALKGHLAELREHGGLLQFTLTTLQVYASDVLRDELKSRQDPRCTPSAPGRSAASFRHVAARAFAIRQAYTIRRKPQEEQGSHLAKVTTTNVPPASQDQSSAIPSAYEEFLAIHDTNKKTDLPRRNGTLPSPANGLKIAHAQKADTSTTQNASLLVSGQLQETSHPVSQSVPNVLPHETFGATPTPLPRDAWGVPKLSAESFREETGSARSLPELPPQQLMDDVWQSKESTNNDSELPPRLSNDVICATVSQNEDGSRNHTDQEAIRPSVTAVETAPPSAYSPSVPNAGVLLMHHSQSKAGLRLTDNMSRVSLLTANTADSAPNSRDPSLFSKGSSVWTADSAFTPSSTHSDARGTTFPAPPLSSVYPIRRKPLGSSKSHDSLLPSTNAFLQIDSYHEHATAASVTRGTMTQSPTPLESVEVVGGPFQDTQVGPQERRLVSLLAIQLPQAPLRSFQRSIPLSLLLTSPGQMVPRCWYELQVMVWGKLWRSCSPMEPTLKLSTVRQNVML